MSHRYISGVVDRATNRSVIAYNITPRLKAGVEINPGADEIGLVANWRALDETARRPALIFGTSSDRIGTSAGQSYYATISKSVELEGFRVAPYAGASYSTYENRFLFPWGVNVPLGAGFSAMIINDGVHTHLAVTYARGHASLTLLAVERDHLGATIGFSF